MVRIVQVSGPDSRRSTGGFRHCLEEGSSMRLRDFRQGWRHGTLSVVTVALAATGLAGVGLAVDVGTAHASTLTVSASEDSYIDSSNAGTNFGTAVWLTADNNPKKY